MLSWLKTLWVPGAILVLLVGISAAVPPRTSTKSLQVRLDASTVAFGVYDPNGSLSQVPGISIQHVFIDWNGPLGEKLRSVSNRAEQLGRDILLTVEPWARPGHTDAASYFKAIMSGQYDSSISELCDGVAKLRGSVLVRWGQEMDAPNDRYPWGGLDPSEYIQAYRHFVDTCRPHAPRAQFVWSPRGDAGEEAYYPGDQYVDFAGLTLFGLEPWEDANYGHARSFAEALTEKYQPIERFGKRLILAEFGVCGQESYREAWISSALEQGSKQFPLLVAVVYFNDLEPNQWPNTSSHNSPECEADSPDWRIQF
jgi:endoglucanase